LPNEKTYQTLSDEQLMRRLDSEGCEASFGELYDRYCQRMHRYFYRMLGQNSHRADDFTQELFMKVVEKRVPAPITATGATARGGVFFRKLFGGV
jgi:RNA polymerase sigma-70 factor, ECF subfamily